MAVVFYVNNKIMTYTEVITNNYDNKITRNLCINTITV